MGNRYVVASPVILWCLWYVMALPLVFPPCPFHPPATYWGHHAALCTQVANINK